MPDAFHNSLDRSDPSKLVIPKPSLFMATTVMTNQDSHKQLHFRPNRGHLKRLLMKMGLLLD